MLKIKDLVAINTQATLVTGVQLSDFYNAEKAEENERLAAGYVFGNSKGDGATAKEVSSLAIFEKIRDSLNGMGPQNIFTVIARYGHGKSHLALVLANYFGRPEADPVLQEIIEHIEACSDPNTANHFRHFKKNNKPLLVVTISGHEIRDLRQGVLQALRRALDANDCANYSIKAISVMAAEWLGKLEGDYRRRAEEIVGNRHNMDLDVVIQGLRGFDSDKEHIAKEISRELYGVPVDFGQEVSLKSVLTQAATDLCEGPDAKFSKMLVLFDELGVYSERWCNDRMRAGHLAPQELIEACFDKPKRICLVGFVQREIGEVVRNFPYGQECMKWARRLPQETHYRLISNLEEVISKLVLPNDKSAWGNFVRDNAPVLQEEAEFARCSFDNYRSWDANHFYQVVVRDGFPLHPLTTGVLCGLDFAQGSRTTIEAVNLLIKSHLDESASNGGRPNWVDAIKLVDVFEKDFQNQSVQYELYNSAVRIMGNNEDQVHYDVLKALFVFYEGKLRREKGSDHIELLARLAGYDAAKVKGSLDYMDKSYGVVRFNKANGEYNFTSVGNNSVELLKLLAQELHGKELDGIAANLTGTAVLQSVPLPNSAADLFMREFAVKGDEWHLAPAFMDAEDLSPEAVKQLGKKTVESTGARGVVVYLLADDAEKLTEAARVARDVVDGLKASAFPYPVVLGLPKAPAAQISNEILLKNRLLAMSKSEKDKYGQSYEEAVARVDGELKDHLTDHLAQKNIQYIAPSSVLFKTGSGNGDLEELSSAIFKEYYCNRPPALSDSLKTNGNKGNTVSAEIGKHLIIGKVDLRALDTDRKNVISTVLTKGSDRWGILDSSHKVQEPTNSRVKNAWNEIFGNIKEDVPTTFAHLVQKLSQPPYGLDEYTLTLLLTAFIGKHRYDLSFAESGRSIRIAHIEAKLDLKAKKFIEWLRKGTVTLTHAGRANKERAKQYLEKLKKADDMSAVKGLLGEADAILDVLAPDDELRVQIAERAKMLRIKAASYEKEANAIENLRADFRSSTDIKHLHGIDIELRRIAAAPDGSMCDAALKELKERIETVAKEQSAVSLGRIEAYTSVRERLEKARHILAGAGRKDLEALFAGALERVEGEYQKLKAAKEEFPLIERINSFGTNSHLPLQYYLDSIEKLGQIETAGHSPRVAELLAAKIAQMGAQVDKLRAWAKDVPVRVEQAADVQTCRNLRDEIISKKSLYAATEDAARLEEGVGLVEGKIRGFEETKRLEALRREQEAADERKRQESERIRAQARSIAEQFTELSDPNERFNCLLEIIQRGKSGLSAEQIAQLTRAFEQ